jgi:hypothetical protein
MLTVIVLNLVALIVLVGGWALAVLALYRGLGILTCRKRTGGSPVSLLALPPSLPA